MDAFRYLREQAAAKRDHAIRDARRVYQDDLAAIEALERRLPPVTTMAEAVELLDKGPNTITLIKTLIPPDQPFTVQNMMDWLHDATKGGKFHEPTVRTYVHRLCKQGLVKRVYKTGQRYTLWIGTEALTEETLIETKPLPDMTVDVLKERGPSTVTEIALAMRERCYRADNSPQGLMRALRDMLKGHRGRFVKSDDGRWELAN